jgi:Nucleotidyl transferase
MKAMVLAAGKGTRLFPFTGVLPKPMARPRMFSYAGSERVTDGTRTRDLRSHNPPNPVSRRCRRLQNWLR